MNVSPSLSERINQFRADAKPCPFCAARNVSVREGSTGRWVVAYCIDCEAQTGEVRRPVTFARDVTDDDWPAAMDEWNRRAEPEQEGGRDG